MNNIKCVVLLFLLSHTLSMYAYVDIHPKKIKNSIIYRKEFLALQSDTSLSKTKISYVSQDEKENKKRKHSRWKALLRSILGFVGLHRFYLGYDKQGWIMACMGYGSIVMASLLYQFFIDIITTSTFFLYLLIPVAIWVLIDIIRIITGDLKFKDGTPTEW